MSPPEKSAGLPISGIVPPQLSQADVFTMTSGFWLSHLGFGLLSVASHPLSPPLPSIGLIHQTITCGLHRFNPLDLFLKSLDLRIKRKYQDPDIDSPILGHNIQVVLIPSMVTELPSPSGSSLSYVEGVAIWLEVYVKIKQGLSTHLFL